MMRVRNTGTGRRLGVAWFIEHACPIWSKQQGICDPILTCLTGQTKARFRVCLVKEIENELRRSTRQFKFN